MGDVKLGGALAVGTVLHATAFFGDVVIDLSSATIPPEGVEIRASVGIGDVRVIVPDGATVKMRSFNVLGDRVEAVDAAHAQRTGRHRARPGHGRRHRGLLGLAHPARSAAPGLGTPPPPDLLTSARSPGQPKFRPKGPDKRTSSGCDPPAR